MYYMKFFEKLIIKEICKTENYCPQKFMAIHINKIILICSIEILANDKNLFVVEGDFDEMCRYSLIQ